MGPSRRIAIRPMDRRSYVILIGVVVFSDVFGGMRAMQVLRVWPITNGMVSVKDPIRAAT